MKPKTWLAMGVAAIAALVFLSPQTRYQCGGNVAARSTVHIIAQIASTEAYIRPGRRFRFDKEDAESYDRFSTYCQDHWIPAARFLVTTKMVKFEDRKPRWIIVVCDTPYRTGPERWFRDRPLMHAAGFSDGSCDYISTAEFNTLDHARFVRLDELYPPPSEGRATTIVH